jgi:hypothetical protein
MVAPAEAVAAIPDDLPAADAAPLLCAGITVFNALRNSGARSGDLVAVQGIGGLGHLGIQYARQMGFRTLRHRPRQRQRSSSAQTRSRSLRRYRPWRSGSRTAKIRRRPCIILATAPDSKAMSSLCERPLAKTANSYRGGRWQRPARNQSDSIDRGPHHHPGMGLRNRTRLRRHHALQRPLRSPSDDRKVPARKSRRSLRPDDQRSSQLSEWSSPWPHKTHLTGSVLIDDRQMHYAVVHENRGV